VGRFLGHSVYTDYTDKLFADQKVGGTSKHDIPAPTQYVAAFLVIRCTVQP